MGLFDSLAGSALTGGLGGIGLALGAVGAIGGLITGEKEAEIQKEAAGVSQQNAGLALQANRWRMQQMYLQSNRSQLENFRNIQRTLSAGKSAAASSGALYGSGYAGGQGQVKAAGATNELNIAQNTEIGAQLGDITQQQDINNIKIAGLTGQAATLQGQGAIFQGIGGLGSGLMSGSKAFGNLFGGSGGGTGGLY